VILVVVTTMMMNLSVVLQDPIPDLVPQDVLDHPVALRVAQDPLDLDRAIVVVQPHMIKALMLVKMLMVSLNLKFIVCWLIVKNCV
jgi:hypothetical protein